MATTHPMIEQVESLTCLTESARSLGYRLPAEFEPQSCVWVSPPANDETWPSGTLEKAQQQFAAFMQALERVTPVKTTQQHDIATVDAWIRDYGPIFMVREDATRASHQHKSSTKKTYEVEAASGGGTAGGVHDFRFNSWGGKYDPPATDDVVPQHIALQLALPIWIHAFVLEGGSIDVNGRGTLLTTEQCLLNPNRNPQINRRQIEAKLRDSLGVEQIIWLPGGIEGDDTDGHIDDLARFVNAGTIVSIRAGNNHPDHAMLEANWQALQAARDQRGNRFELVPLPVPEPMHFDYPGDRFTPARREQLPASYANFLISNGHIFLPVFGQHSDDVACRTLEDAGGMTIVPIRSEHLIIGQGALHCLTMQQPAVADA